MEKAKNKSVIQQPNYKIGKLPTVRIKSISFKNYKVFEDNKFEFIDKNGNINEFICFIGPNGSGKSTVLYTIQLLFSRFDGYEKSRIENNLSKSIRHVGVDKNKNTNFKIVAEISIDEKIHKITIDKSGFKKDYPKEIKELLYRLCYLSKFDQELHKFQLIRDRWPRFKHLFEAVTGYVIEEYANPFFDDSDDPQLSELLKKYVLDFIVYKPNETIHHKECSDGEKKVIKSFSTMLNLDYTPQIILVDNVEMHVERSRHMALVEALRKCFPDSQIFSTTHSYYISKVLGKSAGIYDMRLLKANEFVLAESWRLKIIDEIDDCIIKLKVMEESRNVDETLEEAKKIQDLCYCQINDLQKFEARLTRFLTKVAELFVETVYSKC
jgi:predicted ATP-binding protein involved in virulence